MNDSGMQGWFSMYQIDYSYHYINLSKDKTHKNVSACDEKALDKNPKLIAAKNCLVTQEYVDIMKYHLYPTEWLK